MAPPFTNPPKTKGPGGGKKLKILIGSLLALVLLAAGGFWGWQYFGTEARTKAKLDLGVKYLSENDYEKAVLAFNEAIKIDPKEVKGYQGLAKTTPFRANTMMPKPPMNWGAARSTRNRKLCSSSVWVGCI
ncbi:MAG: tetratricopeptide repeat protein [Syntrophomonas sp.]